MELTINGESRQFDDEIRTVEQLLERLEIEARAGLAVAVGDEVVSRSDWQDHRLEDGDRVEIIRAAQGG